MRLGPIAATIAALVAGNAALATTAHASLIADGITYQLQITSSPNAQTATFDLHITGINGSSDTEKGRYGVESFAFNPPAGFVSATAPVGFTYQGGGLNSSGCNGSGNFFCFDGPSPAHTILAANSTLDFVFTVTLASAGNFLDWQPDFKINWEGTKNNYDLVSKAINVDPVAVPGPVIGAGLPGLLVAAWAMIALARRRKLRFA